MAKSLRCEALAKTTCELKEEREREKEMKEKIEWKKRIRFNNERRGVACACLPCERKEKEKRIGEGGRRLKVSLIFPTIIPSVLLLVARLLFGKLKGPTPSRSRHHSRGAVLLTKDGAKGEWCEHRLFRIRSSGKSATDGEISKPAERDTVSLDDMRSKIHVSLADIEVL